MERVLRFLATVGPPLWWAVVIGAAVYLALTFMLEPPSQRRQVVNVALCGGVAWIALMFSSLAWIAVALLAAVFGVGVWRRQRAAAVNRSVA